MTNPSRRCVRVTMRDGVRIAVDVWLPAGGDHTPRPTILRQTRYLRSVAWRPWASRAGLDGLVDITAKMRRRFLDAGYVWVDVDARGSGASTGSRLGPWHSSEVRDGVEIVDWIVAQPFSNGVVGATGVSYEGTSAEMLACATHPAIAAIAPRFSLFDTFADVALPGGVPLTWFARRWARFNALLDQNRYPEAVGWMAWHNAVAWADTHGHGRWMERQPGLERLVRGGVHALLASACAGVVAPEPAALAAALAEHDENLDVAAAVEALTYRDDTGLSEREPEATIDALSPHTVAPALRASGVPVLSVSGWMDGAYQRSAVQRHAALGADQRWLLLGPWDHGGQHDVSTFNERSRTDFDHEGEVLAFFDRHLRHRDAPAPPRVRAFVCGSERWIEGEHWPPEGVRARRLHLSGGALRDDAPDKHSSAPRALEFGAPAGTGARSRWRTLLGLAVDPGYTDRARRTRRLPRFDGAPLRAPLEVVGEPRVQLSLAARASDATLFVYLEDVAPDGRVTLVTEGHLRALHRRGGADARTFLRADAAPLTPGEPFTLELDLLPMAYRFGAGHRVRVTLADRDIDHFARLPAQAERLDLLEGWLDLPCLG